MISLPNIAVTPFSIWRHTFFEERNESDESVIYAISYIKVVFGSKCLSLLILYTAYLNANSMLESFCSSLKTAPTRRYFYYKTKNKMTINKSNSFNGRKLTDSNYGRQ